MPKLQQVYVSQGIQSRDSETSLSNFLSKLSAKNMVNTYTCFKNNPSCIDHL